MRYLRFALLGLVALAALLVGPVPVAQAATFTVDSTGDAVDANPGNGTCATAGAVCTLRAAIEEANHANNPGLDTIDFSIGGVGVPTISPGSALPTITDPVIIDATTEGAGMVELEGSGAGAGVDGLRITAGSSTVKGLVINRFGGDGIELLTNGGNTIEGNYIGTDKNGTADLGNSWDGVRIDSAPTNTIGGTAAGAGNVISGNNSYGVYITGSGATGNKVEGNLIGTDVNGTADLGNFSDGVYINGAPSNTIGGTTGTTPGGSCTGACNAISGNDSSGVNIYGSGATGNVVEGNYIGTDVTGTVDLGNTYGVSILGAPSNTVGGTAAGARNVISGNDSFGIVILDSGATGNKVEGNYIGTDVNGTADLGNSSYGVLISIAPTNTIGGTAAGARNVISGNDSYGVYISGSASTDNKVEGNYIGTDVNGTVDLGNTLDGVYINGAPSNTVGGTAAGAGNVISGNDVYGVTIYGGSATGNKVEGNYIGTQADGASALGNSSHGVYITFSASDNTIGGAAGGAGNTIAHNGGDGVYVASGTGNLIDPNSIHSNTGLGIDLGTDGVTGNDAGDGDSGANNLQNFPVLTSVVGGGATTTIEATLNSTASTTFTIEFFSNTSCDPSNYGEGETFLGSTVEATDGSGDVSFTVSFGTAVTVGQYVTATATDPSDNTSEFSACEAVRPVFTVDSTGDAVDANPGDGTCATAGAVCTLRAAIEEANHANNPGLDGIRFDIAGATPYTITPGSALPTITDAVAIDGTSEPNFAGTPIVELDGSGAGTSGLHLPGGNSTVEGLVINNFSGSGIVLSGSGGNIIEGNYIGTDVTGTIDQGNSQMGVNISGAPSNTVGGTAAGAGNVISANDQHGVYIDGSGATGNVVEGNYIGTDVNGTADLGNSWDGVVVYDAPSNTIGGTAAGAGNVISGNDAHGVGVGGSGATGNQVEGNYIGTDVTGTVDLGNTGAGVVMDGAPNNTIGGTTSGARNVISGNDQRGVYILVSGATGNVVEGNYIGTDVNGTADLGNTYEGVYISNAPSNTIGGTATGAGNVISANKQIGVYIDGSGATGNKVQGNLIGTDVNGTADLGNTHSGVRIDAGPSNAIGGTAAGAGNVISGNNRFGVYIVYSGATGNKVQGNLIGTDVTGTADLGNTGQGVYIRDAPSNTIGGTDTGARNVISGNNSTGVHIHGGTATGNKVEGNYIGTQADGISALGNSSHGVHIWSAASGNTIGGAAAGAGNTIAFNTGDGVYVESGTGNLIDPNSIHSNTGLGIDLGTDGVTANDPDDPDAGANDLQNFPDLTLATSGSTTTTIGGDLDSTPSTTFTIEFFSNSACDPSGNGEGETFLGSTIEATDVNGDVSFSVSFGTAVTVGQFITATATDPNDNTSEFSACEAVTQDSDDDGVPDTSDNCPGTANPGQENNVHPGTTEGDHCEDPEPDGVFDIDDNCPDVANAGQENTDAVLNAEPVYIFGAPVPADADGDACDTDDDNDSAPGFADEWSDATELYLTNDPNSEIEACPRTLGVTDYWMPDPNMDRVVNSLDLIPFKLAFQSVPGGPGSSTRRMDLNADTIKVDSLDLIPFKHSFQASCTVP